VFEREIDTLIRRGLIDAERRADRGEIRAALYKLFDTTMSRWRRVMSTRNVTFIGDLKNATGVPRR